MTSILAKTPTPVCHWYEPYQKEREVESICFTKYAKKYNIDFPQKECNHFPQIKYFSPKTGRADMLKENKVFPIEVNLLKQYEK